MIIGLCNYCKEEFRKREQKYKFCSLYCSNNFNRNGLKRIKLPKYSSSLAEFVGICLGDGYVSKYQTSITLNKTVDKDYTPYILELASSLFKNAKISIIHRRNEDALDVRVNSRIVADFLINMGIIPKQKKVPNWIKSSMEYKKSCIRGLFDTEGSVSKKIYQSKNKGRRIYYQLNFRNYNKDIMKFVRDTLLEIKLKPTLNPTNLLYISNPKDIESFKKQVGFSNPKLLNKIKKMILCKCSS